LAKGLREVGFAFQIYASVSVCLERESIAAGGASSKKDRRGGHGRGLLHENGQGVVSMVVKIQSTVWY